MNNPLPIVFAALLVFIVGIMISREFEPKMARPQLNQRNNWSSMNTNLSNRALNSLIDVKLSEKNDRYIVTLKGDPAYLSSMDIKLDGRQLNLSFKASRAEKRTDSENGEYSYQSSYQGEFKRSLTLPGPVDEDKMKSAYEDGVVTITLPKK
jgi:HSP20 family molecular chaperone IbpA